MVAPLIPIAAGVGSFLLAKAIGASNRDSLIAGGIGALSGYGLAGGGIGGKTLTGAFGTGTPGGLFKMKALGQGAAIGGVAGAAPGLSSRAGGRLGVGGRQTLCPAMWFTAGKGGETGIGLISSP